MTKLNRIMLYASSKTPSSCSAHLLIPMRILNEFSFPITLQFCFCVPDNWDPSPTNCLPFVLRPAPVGITIRFPNFQFYTFGKHSSRTAQIENRTRPESPYLVRIWIRIHIRIPIQSLRHPYAMPAQRLLRNFN